MKNKTAIAIAISLICYLSLLEYFSECSQTSNHPSTVAKISGKKIKNPRQCWE
jgi:hypothetical protein